MGARRRGFFVSLGLWSECVRLVVGWLAMDISTMSRRTLAGWPGRVLVYAHAPMLSLYYNLFFLPIPCLLSDPSTPEEQVLQHGQGQGLSSTSRPHVSRTTGRVRGFEGHAASVGRHVLRPGVMHACTCMHVSPQGPAPTKGLRIHGWPFFCRPCAWLAVCLPGTKNKSK